MLFTRHELKNEQLEREIEGKGEMRYWGGGKSEEIKSDDLPQYSHIVFIMNQFGTFSSSSFFSCAKRSVIPDLASLWLNLVTFNTLQSPQ